MTPLQRYAQRSVICRSPRLSGCRPVNAGATGVKGEDAVHIRFDFRRGETEVQQSCHVMAADAMTMAHRAKRSRPL